MKARYSLAIAALLCTNLALVQSIAANLPKKDDAHKVHVSNPVQSITKAEAHVARIAIIVDNFEQIDANGDGVVTREELRAFLLTNHRHAPMT